MQRMNELPRILRSRYRTDQSKSLNWSRNRASRRILSLRRGLYLDRSPIQQCNVRPAFALSEKRRTFGRKPPMGRGTIAIRAIASEPTAVDRTPEPIVLRTEIVSRPRLQRNIRGIAAGI